MLKSFFLFFILLFVLNANDKVEIYASSMTSKDNIVTITDGVNVIYKEYFLTADSAIYDRNSGELELFENVRLNNGTEYKVLGKYAKLNIAKKERLFKPFYFSDKETELWISAQEASTIDKDIEIDSGMLSGCNPLDPIWKMEFTSSDYNSDSKWMNLYNARLYIEDIPVFYTPYIGYSLDNTRRSGLLMPAMGYSKREGVFYEQPIYIAEQNWWDLEIKPQIRDKRGFGTYATFRFVESPTAKGEISGGRFKEKDDYFAEHDLKYQQHYGVNAHYENSNFINNWFGLSLEGQSAIYADISYMNDIDYINLSSNDTTENTTATQILSQVNTFYNMDTDYIGTYFKFYEDLTKETGEDTLQVLPSIQYHHYLNTLLDDHFLYSFDVKSDNITRKINKTVIQTDVNIPLTLQTSLFDEYLNISYRMNLYMQHSKFGGEEEESISPANIYNDGKVIQSLNTLSAGTQLTRPYKDLSHVVSFNVDYNKAGYDRRNGNYEDCQDTENFNSTECQFYNISTAVEETKLNFTQYLFNDKAEQIIYHSLSQIIVFGDNNTTLNELENELDYKITDYLSIYNNMFYNYDQRDISKMTNRITLTGGGVNIALSHLYKNNFNDTLERKDQFTSYLTSVFAYKYNSHYSFNALWNYDIMIKENKNREIGFMYKQRCWEFGMRLNETTQPILSADGTPDSINERYLYIVIVLKPIMQSNGKPTFTYKVPETVDGFLGRE